MNFIAKSIKLAENKSLQLVKRHLVSAVRFKSAAQRVQTTIALIEPLKSTSMTIHHLRVLIAASHPKKTIWKFKKDHADQHQASCNPLVWPTS